MFSPYYVFPYSVIKSNDKKKNEKKVYKDNEI